jgi:alkylhydroperoxidase family enzyme
MALLKTVNPKDATGIIAKVYSGLMKDVGVIPSPIEMMSASPGMFENHAQTIAYYMKHPTLNFELLTLIRFLVSPECNFNYCVGFNREILKRMGMEDQGLDQLQADPTQVPLEEKEKALLLFVIKAVKSPESTSQEDMNALRDLGWTDADIYDATFHGARMVAMSIMFNAFKMYDLNLE